MKEISAVERSKKTYAISDEEFIKGDWLKQLVDIKKDGYSFEITYINNFLVIKKFLFIDKKEK